MLIQGKKKGEKMDFGRRGEMVSVGVREVCLKLK